MQTLEKYVQEFGKIINKKKSQFCMCTKDDREVIKDVEKIIGFTKVKFPLMYLGWPIGHAKKRKIHFSELIKKIQNKPQLWKGKLLSFWGEVVLIDSVLKSIPIYLLSSSVPPKCVIHDMDRIFAKFLWKFKEEGSLFDVSKASFAKLWWQFRTNNSLWTNFLWNKYCKTRRPQMLHCQEVLKSLSLCWKLEMLWITIYGGKQRVVIDVLDLHYDTYEDVKQLLIEDKWNNDLLMHIFNEEVVNQIHKQLGGSREIRGMEALRRRGSVQEKVKYIWQKGISFKISFLMWRLWKKRIPIG
ncbi:hypothetical protein H5410_021770 [Solanum commersonii]|uniref:Reverse transcriptase zinc-binding domain-containing protein n=1 Tax=Solanum commersonii TaxID=4109 RepID=A0A9J5ZC97_SOLCO|nr:hypothetical protein H5410_021770 [Solanum commersonii]